MQWDYVFMFELIYFHSFGKVEVMYSASEIMILLPSVGEDVKYEVYIIRRVITSLPVHQTKVSLQSCRFEH
jgi:hypothetical protein